jgi:putative sigma-54 modulation protein
MNLIIHGHHLEVTPALRTYVHDKLARIRRHFDNVIDVDVVLCVDKLQHKAEITLRVRGSALHAQSIEPDLYASIDVMMDKLDRQVLRHKDRVKNHDHVPLKHQSAAGTQ